MEGGIDAGTPLNYAEFQFFSSNNRYEVCACSGNNVETVSSGILEQLLLSSSEVKKLHSRGATSFKVQPPDNLGSSVWFTKSILTRFLHLVGSPDILNITNAIENEISQLEETRRFQLSLGVKAEVNTVASDASKSGLLQAMDMRIEALRGELVAAFNRAAGASCSPKESADLENFSHHFGAINIRNLVHKFVELCHQEQPVDIPSESKFLFITDSRNTIFDKKELSNPSNNDTPVKYGVSPAKAAQVERESSSESEDCSFSNEEDQDRPSVERSRTLVRSASPRRSASPMRRVQIGRSGPHRASALTIKSLNIYPARERAVAQRDAAGNSSEEEGSQKQPVRKSDVNVQRISVQDAISLFEGKKKDQTGDVSKTRSSSIGPNKSVLRRWSSGMGENSVNGLTDTVSESSDTVTPNNLADVENSKTSEEVKPNSEVNVETTGEDIKSDNSEEEQEEADIVSSVQVDTWENEKEESSDKVDASADWSRQKEAELNQLLMKMMETKPAKYRSKAPDNNKSKTVAAERRGGFYDHYKQKRDEKLKSEVAGKRTEKEAQFRAMKKFLDEKKAEMVPTSANDARRKQSPVIPQKPQKNSTKSPISRKETSKPAVVKKASSKATPLPATRKSWPSMPSPRGISPAKTPVGPSSTGITPTRRKPQPAPSAPRSSPKIERTQPKPKVVKPTQSDSTKKRIKGANEKKQQQTPVSKTGKVTKLKVQTSPEDQSSMGKPSFYSKVTRKGSVVPLESKPFLRKGSGIGPGVGPVVVKTKASSQPEESLRKPDPIVQDEENQEIDNTSAMVDQRRVRDVQILVIDHELESEPEAASPKKSEDTGNPNQVTINDDDSSNRVTESGVKAEAEPEEESTISPSAWGEIEEYQEHHIPNEDSPHQITSRANNIAPVGPSSPRVRHSLSQMLLEESSEEPDIMEWGNAENPPAMVYQKDAPKGLKRLLKFAGRKNKSETHSTGWSSPSAFSEGEDEAAEEAKASRRNPENLLRKAALNANNYGHQKTSLYDAHEKNSVQSDINKYTGHNTHKLQDDIASPTAAKARSFFSLSAFRGNRPNETKLR